MSTPPDSTKPAPDLRFKCPECKGKIVVDGSAVGFYANCPHCDARILIRRQAPVAAPPPAPAKPVKEIPPAAQTASGIHPIPAGHPILTTTQMIETQKKTTAPLTPSTTSRGELITTQKISPQPAGAVQKIVPASPPRPAPPNTSKLGSLNRTEPIRTEKSAGDTFGGDADARVSFTSLIEGLKRENAELKKKLAAQPPASATTPAPDVSPAPTAELEKLRAAVVRHEALHKESEVEVALLRSQRDSARSTSEHFHTFADSAAAREKTLATERDALLAALKKQDLCACEITASLEQQRDAAARTFSDAMTQRLDLAALRDALAAAQRELASAARARDIATADTALARQSLREDVRQQQVLQSSLEAVSSESTATTRERDELRQKLSAATTQHEAVTAKLRQTEDLLAQAPKHDALSRLTNEATGLRAQLDRTASELAGLRMSEQAFRNRYNELTGEVAKLSADNTSLAAETTQARQSAEKLGSDNRQLRDELAGSATKLKDLTTRLERITEENERLLSEKSALGMAFDEVKERAQQLDADKWRSQELARKLTALTEENESIREQLVAAAKVASDVQNSIKRIAELEGENEMLRAQIKQTEHEIAVRASPNGMAMVEARFRRRIEELEATLRTAEAVTHTLRSRVGELEKDQRRQPAAPPEPPPAAIAALEEKVSALQKQLFESETLARKAVNERDAATRGRIEAEAAVDALSGQARDLQDHLDALNKKIAATPSAALLAEVPQPPARKTKHGATHHGDTKPKALEPLAAKVATPDEPATAPTPAAPAPRSNPYAATIAIILALAASIAFLWYITQAP